MRKVTRSALLLTLAGIAACDQRAQTTQPILTHQPQGSGLLSGAAVNAVNADRALLRSVTQAAARDGIVNANKWFGDRKHRNRQSVCDGLPKLLAKHMVAFDAGRTRKRTPEERLAAARQIVLDVGCGAPAPMALFGRPMAMVAMPSAVPDAFDDWLGDNWRPGSWSEAIDSHAANDGGPIGPYAGGMTEFEVATFDAVRCSQVDLISDIAAVEGETGGGYEMTMFFMPQWGKAALRGCASNVIGNVGDIVTGARIGFAMWGPWGAAGAAAAIAAEHCIFGGIAGYLLWAM